MLHVKNSQRPTSWTGNLSWPSNTPLKVFKWSKRSLEKAVAKLPSLTKLMLTFFRTTWRMILQSPNWVTLVYNILRFREMWYVTSCLLRQIANIKMFRLAWVFLTNFIISKSLVNKSSFAKDHLHSKFKNFLKKAIRAFNLSYGTLYTIRS